jgi:hypothetical protein
MTRLLSNRRGATLGGAGLVAAAAALALFLPGSAGAQSDNAGAVPAPPASPTSADQIQNIDQVRTAIKGYYGDTVTTDVDPVPNNVDGGDNVLHTFNPAGAYANEVAGVVTDAEKYLAKPKPKGVYDTKKATKAVLFDVDDTLLNTYNYEIYSNFVYNPTTNAAFVNAAAFPAVPHMVELEQYAESKGYTVFFLTGRPIAQHDGTLTNLVDQGYDVTDANLYLKDKTGATQPWLLGCAPTCTTIQYKSLTRAHIESLGYEIVANFGDQYSDLLGGHADRTFKLPNPMYYLP